MKNYKIQSSLFQNAILCLKENGIGYTLKLIWMKIFSPLCNFLNKKHFIIGSQKYKYFLHSYNNTWDNERAVEIPIFTTYLKKFLDKQQKVLEIGNVMSHYFNNNGRWTVVDKFERSEGVINIDIIDFKPENKYQLIIGISTFEHIGFDDSEIDENKVIVALSHVVNRLLAKEGLFIISIPIGYNKSLDRKILKSELEPSKELFIKRNQYLTWEVADKNELKNEIYGKPYSGANVLAILYFHK